MTAWKSDEHHFLCRKSVFSWFQIYFLGEGSIVYFFLEMDLRLTLTKPIQVAFVLVIEHLFSGYLWPQDLSIVFKPTHTHNLKQ